MVGCMIQYGLHFKLLTKSFPQLAVLLVVGWLKYTHLCWAGFFDDGLGLMVLSCCLFFLFMIRLGGALWKIDL